MQDAFYHTPVLVDEALSLLITGRDGVYVDATLGGGGHAEAILSLLSPSGQVIGFDADEDAIRFAAQRLQPFGDRVTCIRNNFRNLQHVLVDRGVPRVSGVLFDLGVSSFQLDEPSKGFSFRTDERLDMRMDRSGAIDAQEIVNRYGERELAELFWKYGEERASRRIARAIVRRRDHHRIATTGDLATLVQESVGERFLNKSLARIFQALRIEVNNELESLQAGLNQAVNVLHPGGRIVVIAYHSLEDRIVKDTFKRAAATSLPSGHKLVPDTILQPTLKIITKKPLEASGKETRANPRARSAKLRAAEKIIHEGH
ncbi:MAG: 16S rRNA (cytosine(1402)-N(4))-methyltransferase RsmH [Bacteroidota bacterium]